MDLQATPTDVQEHASGVTQDKISQYSDGTHHHRRRSSVSPNLNLSLMPLPTIETVIERSSLDSGTARGVTQSVDSVRSQGSYKTVIHVPKPPNLRRRENLDAALLQRVLRETAHLRLNDRGSDETAVQQNTDEKEDPDKDVAMYSSASSSDNESEPATSPTLSFHTSASTRSSSTETVSSEAPSPGHSTSDHSPASSTLVLPPTSAYPSPPSTPFLPPISPPSSPTQHPIPKQPASESDEMDWSWSLDHGDVVYGAAGVAVSPRAMGGDGNVCCRCWCDCGEDGEGDEDWDMELYVIDEETGEEEEEEGGVAEGELGYVMWAGFV